MKKKITLLTGLAAAALAWNAFAQEPTPSPTVAATPATTLASPTVAPASSPSATADDLESRIKARTKGVHIKIDTDRKHHKDGDGEVNIDGKDFDDLGALAAIPIVGIIFGSLSIFGAPIFIVLVIMFFTYLKQRSLHRTVRMMVEKGQPVPPALFAPPPVVKARSDMRRGVILIMIGVGLMFFFAAMNDWEGGAWTLGLIPFLIGAGYLTVWKLEGHRAGALTANTISNTSTDNPPAVP
jgi:hypothetical protein